MTTTEVAPTIRPFTIEVPGADIDDLNSRLDRIRWPNVPDGTDGHGFALSEVRALVDRWRHTFDWRSVEARLNELNHLMIDVDGVAMHAVHERAAEASDRLPVVLLHGWPDSFVGMIDVMNALVEAGHDVIVPSLLGYGFSGQPAGPLAVETIAAAVDTVVDRLGYDRYAVHGGDWGSAVAEHLALTRPERVGAIHLLDVPYYHMFLVDTAEATDDAERAYLEAAADWGDTSGYLAIQSTQPLTLAYGLSDSPVGLLAWIGEKYSAWTDRAPDPDAVLTLASLYWFTNTIWSSTRLYAEGMTSWDDEDSESESDWSTPAVVVPAAFALFPADITIAPRTFAERFFTDIRRYSVMPSGGHFAAREQPQAVAAEIVAFLSGVAAAADGSAAAG